MRFVGRTSDSETERAAEGPDSGVPKRLASTKEGRDRVPATSRKFIVVALASMVAACSHHASGPAGGTVATEPPKADVTAVVSSLQEDSIRRAREELEQGQNLAQEGKWTDARRAFDRAVDILLEIPGGVEESTEARNLYDEVVATIHETERDYLARLAATAEDPEQEDEAAVDELTNDASLMEPDESSDLPEKQVELPESATYDIPMEINGRVASIIEMFQNQKAEWFQEALDRGAPLMPMFRSILEEEGVPTDLVYLAMVESAFKTRAVSRAGARGIWQFIRGTGRLYGLHQNYWVDDRFDPEKATRAAARHLLDLYNEFDDWYLAMAAYNCGPKRIERAIKRSGIRDFWTLAKKRYLPRETRSYVPLILAAAVIAKNPESYGFTTPSAPALDYDVVELDHPVDLETAAASAGTSVEVMKLLNPELRHWVTPLDEERHPLKIPKGTLAAFREAIAAIPEDERVRFGSHVVRRGDTLSGIADRYGTTIAALTSANRLSVRSILHPGQELVVPVPPGALSKKKFFPSRDSIAEGDREVYVVARGDTLGAIARSFHLSLDQLRALNGLPAGWSRIHPGDKLVVSRSSSRPARKGRAVSASRAGGVYVVRSGDTLGGIADAHGISLSQLRDLNDMPARASRIYPGQNLVVGERGEDEEPSPASDGASDSTSTRYRIRRGDTLSGIANRFGVSVAELRRWNQMDTDRIVAGELLTIFTAGATN